MHGHATVHHVECGNISWRNRGPPHVRVSPKHRSEFHIIWKQTLGFANMSRINSSLCSLEKNSSNESLFMYDCWSIPHFCQSTCVTDNHQGMRWNNKWSCHSSSRQNPYFFTLVAASLEISGVYGTSSNAKDPLVVSSPPPRSICTIVRFFD
jgi:hypothetical protein